VPTIKYYLREGLLPAGELSSPNQASYDETHVRRLRLIRALIDLAQVPVAKVKEILESLDADTETLHEQIGRAHRALTPTRRLAASDDARTAATAQVSELIANRGWWDHPRRNPHRLTPATRPGVDLGRTLEEPLAFEGRGEGFPRCLEGSSLPTFTDVKHPHSRPGRTPWVRTSRAAKY
jgi:DNA-binding transcriptional MerR regulator